MKLHVNPVQTLTNSVKVWTLTSQSTQEMHGDVHGVCGTGHESKNLHLSV